ncbi:MAG: hypothetical protein OQK98_06360 [Gammaproteobacteria bacterium]|nr:hypothetical protein [Gammaproteobacteria bacterium]
MPSVSAIAAGIAAGQFVVNFKFILAERIIERDNFYVENTQHLWFKGINRTYVKLNCIQNKSGEIEKRFSMSEIFTGFRIIHILDGDEVKLTVVRRTALPRRSMGTRKTQQLLIYYMSGVSLVEF